MREPPTGVGSSPATTRWATECSGRGQGAAWQRGPRPDQVPSALHVRGAAGEASA